MNTLRAHTAGHPLVYKFLILFYFLKAFGQELLDFTGLFFDDCKTTKTGDDDSSNSFDVISLSQQLCLLNYLKN